MIKLTAKIREEMGRKTRILKDSGRVPAVIYGHGIKNASLDLDYKEFIKALKGTRLVLVHDLQKDPVSDKYIHVDFFETSAKEEVEVGVLLVIEGTSLAVKDLGGTLVQYINELEIKAMPQDLPHDIKVVIDGLNTFEDRILVKDLILPKGIKVLTKPDEIVVSVAPPANVEEDLAKEIEEKVEDVEKVEKDKKEEVVIEDEK